MAKDLTQEEIQAGTQNGIKKYEHLDFLGKYAMYMGVAQLLEFGLKKLHEEKYGNTLEEMERWTLGKTKDKLAAKGLRPDFIHFLESVVKSRNYIAHEILANFALMRSITDNLETSHYSKDERILDKAILELEQLIFLFDWTNQNNGW
ncbi:hypothetical protein [Flavobacterium sedimenticola]|uniref:DUF4924 domain-containing protein n=1 Tax=Flavobacterium sedimenticola TaxID=3043286 RepID=A0ABT6XPW4_9FLAO|nr:hypothetical protein [Flavobacterium sedimenticola]MDI9256877.1 hypothetical protein [Flavobacterium sedimenticola]